MSELNGMDLKGKKISLEWRKKNYSAEEDCRKINLNSIPSSWTKDEITSKLKTLIELNK